MRRAIPVVTVATLALAVGAGTAPARPADQGILQRFAPRSATTWWAIVESNLVAGTWVVRTTDSGRRWHTVTPPVKLVSSSAFLGSDVAWIESDALHPPRTEPVFRTLDGGRSWRRLGRVASGCQLAFVDLRHGWCISLDAAAGSEFVRVYRTGDGGSSWRLVSRTGVPGQSSSTHGALPSGCDKTIAFTSAHAGWAALYCNAGEPLLYASNDGGARWHKLPAVRVPKGAPSPTAGGGISLPTGHGSRLAVSLQLDGTTRVATVIATSTNGGRSWRSRLVPGSYWSADLIDQRHWRLADGSTLLSTDDAGGHWRSRRAAVGTPTTPDFLTPRLGFLVPDSRGTPLWWTRDDGATWKPITVTAGPYTVGG
jgi:photosystem II stability/assembly factor-like uncharacterized protein